jgi:hypothetical protein
MACHKAFNTVLHVILHVILHVMRMIVSMVCSVAADMIMVHGAGTLTSFNR